MTLIDASVWVALSSPTERFHAEAERIVASGGELSAMDLTLYEIANAIGVKMDDPARSRRIQSILLRRCGDRLLRVDRELIELALEIAAEHGITAYDAAYVAAARRHAMTLVSADLRDLVSKGLAVAPDAAV